MTSIFLYDKIGLSSIISNQKYGYNFSKLFAKIQGNQSRQNVYSSAILGQRNLDMIRAKKDKSMREVNQTPTFNLKVVVRETGLKPDTLRAWERRYGMPQPERTEGGHRLYSQQDIDTILEIKNLLYTKKFTIAGAISTLSKHQEKKIP